MTSSATTPADHVTTSQRYGSLEENTSIAYVSAISGNSELIRKLADHEQMVSQVALQFRAQPELNDLIDHVKKLYSIIKPFTRNLGTHTFLSGAETFPMTSNSSNSFRTARSHLTGPSQSDTLENSTASLLPSLRPSPPRRRTNARIRDVQSWTNLPRQMHCRDSVKDIRRFLGSFGSTNRHDLNLTTRLFFAVGSPYAILQLRDIFKALKRNDALLPFSKPSTLKTAVQAIARSGDLKLVARLQNRISRFYLVNIYERRARRLYANNQRPRSFADSEVLSAIIIENQPDLESDNEELQNQMKTLRNLLYSSRNWYRLASRFGVGILLLVPWGGEFDIYDSHIQKISQLEFDGFVNLLDEKRGVFLRRCSRSGIQRFRMLSNFETICPTKLEEIATTEAITEKHFDSDGLLDLLRPV
ncbi:hypothetical protein BO82DRAFT_436643 [Aspergillus uvarum CBS 121591]|uniref:Uncharacterized protein n=1 Tax=Aspergillus uvarum CBS 121591 TaxID=1448315 RepID=A0A319D8X7_9EURO|nr:hypothetical protein BO82DRAFT_436643 [Aspergillus uvarum CBS 121591]PYH76422.1 hypothetical protein BO82DRAFT_436643 [Aspergillus uvarum CBS 121591]